MKAYEPAAVGVPEIAPSARSRPGGSVPVETVHAYVPNPPVAVSDESNGAPTSPAARRAAVNGSAPEMRSGSRTTMPSAFVSERESALTFA